MGHLTVGDPAPWFTARSPVRLDYHFATTAGRYVVLSFIGSAAAPGMDRLVARLAAEPGLFDNVFAGLFVVSADPQDEKQGRLAESPGVHIFWDSDRRVTDLYGLARGGDAGTLQVTPTSFVLDPQLRVLAVLPFHDSKSHARQIIETLTRLKDAPPQPIPAPVLLLPRIFEPDFCRRLIRAFDGGGSEDSGFMRTDPKTGKTVLIKDANFKRRRDHVITDGRLRGEIQQRLHRRLAPEIRKCFQFNATRIERYLVARYAAEDRGGFNAHRDNTTKGTAHRRFAVTINLNAEDYEGGDLVFPEFSSARWRAPTGGAVVFSCSLMHEARPVTRGVRYCFLPFLYDEEAAKIMQENRRFVDIPGYSGG